MCLQQLGLSYALTAKSLLDFFLVLLSLLIRYYLLQLNFFFQGVIKRGFEAK